MWPPATTTSVLPSGWVTRPQLCPFLREKKGLVRDIHIVSVPHIMHFVTVWMLTHELSVCLGRGPSKCIRHTNEGKGRVHFMGSQFPTPRARQASVPLCSMIEGHTRIALCSSTRSRWQWSTTQFRPVPGWSIDQSFESEGSVYCRNVWECYYVGGVPYSSVNYLLVVEYVKASLLEAGTFIK